GLKALASIPAFCLDVITFLPRLLIGAPLRAIYNATHKPPEHPLVGFLKSEGKDKKNIPTDVFKIVVTSDKVEINDLLGAAVALETITKSQDLVATKMLPGHHSKHTTSEESHAYIKIDNNRWKWRSTIGPANE